MTSERPPQISPQRSLVTLVSATEKAKKAVRNATDIQKWVTKLSRRETWGVLGLFVGAVAAGGACIATGTMLFAPFFVPASGVICLMLANLATSDKREDQIRAVWGLRDQEVEALSQQIAADKRARLAPNPILIQKRLWLNTASPDDLLTYYRMGRPISEDQQTKVVIDESEKRMLALTYQPAETVAFNGGASVPASEPVGLPRPQN